MKNVITATSLVNFGPVTSEILWLICMGSECLKLVVSELKYAVRWFLKITR